MQEIHLQTLREFHSMELELEKSKNALDEVTESYGKLKEDHKKVMNDVGVFKAECNEKLRKARADKDIRVLLEEREKEVRELGKEKEEILKECEKDKIAFLQQWQSEKSDFIKRFEEEKQYLVSEISMLRALREPISRNTRS